MQRYFFSIVNFSRQSWNTFICHSLLQRTVRSIWSITTMHRWLRQWLRDVYLSCASIAHDRKQSYQFRELAFCIVSDNHTYHFACEDLINQFGCSVWTCRTFTRFMKTPDSRNKAKFIGDTGADAKGHGADTFFIALKHGADTLFAVFSHEEDTFSTTLQPRRKYSQNKNIAVAAILILTQQAIRQLLKCSCTYRDVLKKNVVLVRALP